MNTTRPQNLETIYEALANSGDVGGEDNRNYQIKVHIIKTDIKNHVLPRLMNCNERDIKLYKTILCPRSKNALTTEALHINTYMQTLREGGQRPYNLVTQLMVLCTVSDSVL